MRQKFFILSTVGILAITAIFTGCNWTCNNTYTPNLGLSVIFDHTLVGEDDLVYLPVSKNGTNYCYQKTATDEWLSVEASVCEAQSSKEIISYEGNTVTVTDKETGDILFTDTLPTVAQVSEETNTSYDGTEAYAYTYLRMDDYNATWDRKTHFMAVGLYSSEFNTYGNYYAITKKDNTTWKIEKIAEKATHREMNQFTREIVVNSTSCHYDERETMDIVHSYHGKIFNCPFVGTKDFTCYTTDSNGSVTPKQLFGGIYSPNYSSIITAKRFYTNGMSHAEKENSIVTYTYFFDKQNRLNILYVDANANGNYMIYEMYENGNQTTPTLTQKIYL